MSLAILLFIGLATAAPCDIYSAAGTPCVAAHSTTRSLYSAYNGPLYQLIRDDGVTQDITTSSGIADSASQDVFCSNADCSISIVYDQSGQQNHLTRALAGGFPGPAAQGADNLANATAAPIYLSGKKVYGLFIEPGSGYRNNQASGTAVDDEPEGIYAVFDGTHYNGNCCFDYGNAETSSTDTGGSHMEAIYFGSSAGWGNGGGEGPWIMADLENGLYGGSQLNSQQDPSLDFRFVTAIVKGNSNNSWAIRGGDATTGDLQTFYNGVRPDGYSPMNKEGSIILGTGGDNSNGGEGTFYEGVMTSGFPSDETENAVQADIIAAGYSVDLSSNTNSSMPTSTGSGSSPTSAASSDFSAAATSSSSSPSTTSDDASAASTTFSDSGAASTTDSSIGSSPTGSDSDPGKASGGDGDGGGDSDPGDDGGDECDG